MKNVLLILSAWMACTIMALPQTSPTDHFTAAQVLEERVSAAEKEIVPAAEAMPEDKFSFAPTDGEFKGVRTFGEQVKHLAAANYQLSACILGEAPPHGERNESAPESVRSKQEVVEYLKGSFVSLHRAVASVDKKNLTAPISGTKGTWQRTRLGLAIDAIAHSYDHYGQVVEYLRMNGIVPPASR
ncbi:MAG TPA: DinB family protein [Terriglobales bacterium]|nr:DinB family protein [Terriglobales bacterium]